MAAGWSEGRDVCLKRMCAEGVGWPAACAALGLPLCAVLARALRLGVRMRRARAGADPERAPLPAGHPVSWDALNAGTCLAGAAYPLPVWI